MKAQQLTIFNTNDLRNFVNRNDVSIENAFAVTKKFLSKSNCITFETIDGTGEPTFDKKDIIDWINKFDSNPELCSVYFIFQ